MVLNLVVLLMRGISAAGNYSCSRMCTLALGCRIHQGNKDKKRIHINLKGFAMGNGLTQPNIQYEAYADFALENGLIDNGDYKRLSLIYPACAASIKLCGTKGTVTCIAAYLVCNSIFNSILSIPGNINVLDEVERSLHDALSMGLHIIVLLMVLLWVMFQEAVHLR